MEKVENSDTTFLTKSSESTVKVKVFKLMSLFF